MTTVTALPTPPTRADAINFAERADDFLAALPTFGDELNTVAGEVNTNAANALASYEAAAASAVVAAAAESAAIAAAAVSIWVSGGTYSVGNCRFSTLNFQTYRCTNAVSGSTTDPSEDSVNWSAIGNRINTTNADSDASLSIGPIPVVGPSNEGGQIDLHNSADIPFWAIDVYTTSGVYTYRVWNKITGDANIVVNETNHVGVGDVTALPTNPLDIFGNSLRIRTQKTPASASDTGLAGEYCNDANYLYICTATNTWKRIALSTW